MIEKLSASEWGAPRAMPACVINDPEVTDPVIFDEDRKRSPPTLAQFGGRFVVRGGAVGSLERDWLRKRLVVLGSMSSTAQRAGAGQVRQAGRALSHQGCGPDAPGRR